MFRQIWRKFPLDNRQFWLPHKVDREKTSDHHVHLLASKMTCCLAGR
jgi:hypothetical protein